MIESLGLFCFWVWPSLAAALARAPRQGIDQTRPPSQRAGRAGRAKPGRSPALQAVGRDRRPCRPVTQRPRRAASVALPNKCTYTKSHESALHRGRSQAAGQPGEARSRLCPGGRGPGGAHSVRCRHRAGRRGAHVVEVLRAGLLGVLTVVQTERDGATRIISFRRTSLEEREVYRDWLENECDEP